MNTPDPETTAFRLVYSMLLDRVPEAPAFEELASRAAEQLFVPPRRQWSAPVAVWATGAVLLVLVAAWLGRAPSALAIIDQARSAAVSVSPFRALLTVRVDGATVGEELSPGSIMPDWVYVDELWYRDESAWKRSILEDPLPQLRGGAGSITVWDGTSNATYRSDENTYALGTSADHGMSPLRELSPAFSTWPLLTGGSLPPDQYFAERCRLASAQEVAGRPTRHLSCEEGAVEVWLDQETGLVLKAIGTQAGHEVTSIEYDPAFSPELFVFKPPAGSRSVDEANDDPSTHIGLAVGEPAPAWEVTLLDGSRLLSEDLAGRPALILLWADWCPSCLEALPTMQRVYQTWSARAGMVAVATLGPTRAVEDLTGGYNFPVALDLDCPIEVIASGEADCGRGPLAESWGLESVPVWVVLDREGRVAAILLGGDVTFDRVDDLLQAQS